MSGMWGFASRLPDIASENVVTLGEGDTPLVDVSRTLGRDLGVGSLVIKCEDRNPTGSFKARIASVAASLVRERGLRGLVGTSSGNGGAAAAAYSAAAGSAAILFTLSDTVPVKLAEILAAGAEAVRVKGVGHDAASTRSVADTIARAATLHRFYPMLTGFHFAPEAMMGVQTIAWEIERDHAEVTHVYAPVGGGGLVTGLWRGFADGRSRPRVVGVHPEGASALAWAMRGVETGMPSTATTSISGLQMAVLYDTEGAVNAVRASRGWVRSVADDEIGRAQRVLARNHGLLVEPAGAAALAGVLRDVEEGRLGSSDHVVAVATGAGYKDLAALERMTDDPVVPVISADLVGTVLRERVGTP